MISGSAPGPPHAGPYTDRAAAFRAFADLYHALARMGQDVAACRRLEVWQVAAILGVDYERDPDAAEAASVDSSRGSSDLLRRRRAWQMGDGPMPEVAATRTVDVMRLRAT